MSHHAKATGSREPSRAAPHPGPAGSIMWRYQMQRHLVARVRAIKSHPANVVVSPSGSDSYHVHALLWETGRWRFSASRATSALGQICGDWVLLRLSAVSAVVDQRWPAGGSNDLVGVRIGSRFSEWQSCMGKHVMALCTFLHGAYERCTLFHHEVPNEVHDCHFGITRITPTLEIRHDSEDTSIRQTCDKPKSQQCVL